MKTLGKIIYTVIWLCLAAAVLVSGYMLEMKLNEYRTAQDIQTERVLEARKGRTVDFARLKAENPDTKGWIWLRNTHIDYPIVQGPDNDYYLHRDFSGKYLYDGCIFIDSAVSEPFSESQNTVIYGHRMRSGAMFNNLGKYADREFFDEHPVIIIETEDASYDLHVVAFCREMSDSPLYTVFFDEEAFSGLEGALTKSDFIELVRRTAVNLSDEPIGEDDVIVTLSTCAYSTGEQRNQVIGVLKDAPVEEKVVTTETEKPAFNKWLLAQIGVGIVMLVVLIIPVLPGRKKVRKSHEGKGL